MMPKCFNWINYSNKSIYQKPESAVVEQGESSLAVVLLGAL
jgi:hypothetical protein